MQIEARAKINWTLNVVGKRWDGYHLLDGIMQPLTLHDTLFIAPSDALTLVIDGAPALSAGEDNLVLRAARALQEAAGVRSGAQIHLQKRIPMGAGLGGGSADCAAALKGLNDFWGVHLDIPTLCKIGAKLGADVPFCVVDSPCRAQGIGEILTPLHCLRTFPLVLIQPCEALSTKEVFTAYHQSPIAPPDTEGAIAALAAGNLTALNQAAGNVLESASIPLRPQILQAKDALTAHGAAMARMTGSGSVVFGAFSTFDAAHKAYEELKSQYAVCILTETAL